MHRRRFLSTALQATGGLCAGLPLAACASDADPSNSTAAEASGSAAAALPAIGLQLYTIRSVLDKDFRKTMEQVAEIGYDEVEFAGYYDRSPKEINALLDELGLAAPATHVPLSRIRKAPGAIIRTAKTIGHQYVVCPYLAEKERTSLDDYRQRAKEFSAFGQRCTKAGLQFAYHNHDFEFMAMEGTRPYDVLLQETSPKHVQMEIDLYWIVEAGHDPLEYIAQAPDRYPLCHVKDRGANGGMVSVGKGTIDFASIFREANFQHYFVEHDNPENPMQSIKTSHRTLQNLKI
ncbi:MAG: sugar phosphate isomerase/epimerase family protein [Salinibacter sp.]|uniref:sugar phosphate isomerase/epimerase family protein n=1 Tax=Salinibacter sp. TaxID=2065818 RepID=UPI0035D50239